MWVGVTVDDNIQDEDAFMIVASRSDLEAIARNLDGIGHHPATMKLLRELKGWGISK